MNKLLGVSTFALLATEGLVQADTVDVQFKSAQYVFACDTLADLEYIIEGTARSPEVGRERRMTKRLPAEVGGPPLCDYLTANGGKYTKFTSLGGLLPLSLDDSFAGGMLSGNVRVYVISTVAGDPRFMMLYFPMETAPFTGGYDMLTNILGVE